MGSRTRDVTKTSVTEYERIIQTRCWAICRLRAVTNAANVQMNHRTACESAAMIKGLGRALPRRRALGTEMKTAMTYTLPRMRWRRRLVRRERVENCAGPSRKAADPETAWGISIRIWVKRRSRCGEDELKRGTSTASRTKRAIAPIAAQRRGF